MSKKRAFAFSIEDILTDLDGYGLIVTDTDLIKERLEDIGLTYDSETIVTNRK